VKRLLVMIPAILVICLFFAVSASAASDEPQAAASFDVNIVVNGDEYAVVSVSASAEGNVYAFDLSELLCALGVDMAYDEDTQTVSLTAKAAPAEEAEKAGPVKPSAWPAGKGDVHALRAVTAEEPGPAVEEDKPAAQEEGPVMEEEEPAPAAAEAAPMPVRRVPDARAPFAKRLEPFARIA